MGVLRSHVRLDGRVFFLMVAQRHSLKKARPEASRRALTVAAPTIRGAMALRLVRLCSMRSATCLLSFAGSTWVFL